MQCPICGRDTVDLIDGRCPPCAAERLPILEVPEVVDVESCAHCRRIHIGASWRDLGPNRSDRVETYLRSVVTVDPLVSGADVSFAFHWEDERNATADVAFRGRLRDVPVERNVRIRVRVKTTACPDCSREAGGYFEATLQVRGSPGTDLPRLLPLIEHVVVERLESFKAEGRPNSFVTEVDRDKNGHDYVMGSHEIARILATEIADTWGGERDESTKLFTRKDGRDVFRWTMLVRLPPYARGDFLLLDDKPYKLLSFDRRNLLLLDLERRRRVRREVRRVKSLKVIGRASEQHDAIIVSRGGQHAQIMDPLSYKTIDVPNEEVPPDVDSVPVFRHDETLYLVRDPDDQTRQ